MEKIIELAPHSNCTGCAACSDVCPTNSIIFVEKGIHTFPQINNETCIQCGKCMSVCQVLKPHEFHGEIEQKFYCAWNKNIEERKSSTSGGAGSAMAFWAKEHGYFVCGAGFDKNWYLRHISSRDQKTIDSFRGSKYLKSDTYGTLREVAKLIGQGERVFFTGTPCQCDAVERIVPQSKRDQLITCAIICHGVNSPKIWSEYVSYLEKNEKSRLVEYNFRSKTKGWGQDKRGGEKLRILKKMANGKSEDQPAWRNLFHDWFGYHYILRESCFKCQYRTVQRFSDITIGDFWGISSVLPDLDTHEGVSVVITSSEKGERFVKGCKQMELIPVDESLSLKGLKGIVNRASEERINFEIKRNKQFEEDYMKYGFDEMTNRYPVETFIGRAISALKSRLHIK